MIVLTLYGDGQVYTVQLSRSPHIAWVATVVDHPELSTQGDNYDEVLTRLIENVGGFSMAGFKNFDADGNPILRLASATASGQPSMAIQDTTDDCEIFERSWLIECAPNEITLRDICISNDLVGSTGISLVVGSSFGVAWDEEHPRGAKIGSDFNVDLIDRDDVLGYFAYYTSLGIPTHRSKLADLTGMTGTFVAGEQIRGATCRARVLAVFSDYLEISFDRWDSAGEIANFTDGEVITGQTSGATAVLDTPAFTEGGFVFLQRFVKNRALYGKKYVVNKPGGARPVPPGLYFRCSIFNADTVYPLFMDGTINVGKK